MLGGAGLPHLIQPGRGAKTRLELSLLTFGRARFHRPSHTLQSAAESLQFAAVAR